MSFGWHLKLTIIILPQFSRHFHIFLCLNSHNSLSLLSVTGNPSDHTVFIAKKKGSSCFRQIWFREAGAGEITGRPVGVSCRLCPREWVPDPWGQLLPLQGFRGSIPLLVPGPHHPCWDAGISGYRRKPCSRAHAVSALSRPAKPTPRALRLHTQEASEGHREVSWRKGVTNEGAGQQPGAAPAPPPPPRSQACTGCPSIPPSMWLSFPSSAL